MIDASPIGAQGMYSGLLLERPEWDWSYRDQCGTVCHVDARTAFGPLLLLGLTEKKLVLGTRLGNLIENVIELDPNDQTRAKWARLAGQHRQWVRRKADTGVYNCAGMVWASRRTMILGDYHQILADDGFRRLNAERPRIGDLALYVEDDHHAHVGIICSLEAGLAAGSPEIPRVLSKWDSVSGEFLHLVNDHPFGAEVRVEYWTERPHGE